MRQYLRPAALAIVLATLVLGIAYPLLITGVAKVAFPGKADGSLVKVGGRAVGSSLLAQAFTKPVLGPNGKPKVDSDGNPVTEPDPRYFQPRPSVTGYNPAGTYFSNRGPNSAVAAYAFRANMRAYLALEKPYDPSLTAATVPVDGVTTSASGVDPHISPANARVQAYRIASQRGIPRSEVLKLIDQNTDGRSLGVLGMPGVNVLKLNLALDAKAPTS
ncbi:MAG TPA: potassium-transporting ATPase subunit C [Solirubrobacteraceae bacterium]|nr:potassium-transporting ATPase subunit C [Solirubrobacteraceae bacterium]